ncbi:H+/Cl- antiporter ClcA [Variovorax boronicumulans]|uniref:chloride channel protein n=1 Tax=Variovorax boronicumulans TaxID=436515 RepID=UPI00277D1DAA|nr:chloride channel protein [Variovorax boronicumulans]MDQ0073878.1 H+/Cl- antiporter ClcA [Variovorax boronicumulans]
MNREPDFLEHLRAELSSGRIWLDRAIVLGYAIAAGLFVVGFTLASDWVFGGFQRFYRAWPWAVLVTTPMITAGIVWFTLRFFPGASGSGIPQIKAALHPALPDERRFMFASLRLTVAKIGLGVAGFAAGLSIGREGPSVQVAAGVMQHARRWLSPNTTIDGRALLVAGGAAGIAAAFNAPLAGVVFAIEELSGRLEARSSGLIITAIVLAGLVAVSAFGNTSYFGVIRVPRLGWDALGPGLLVTLLAGAAGGLFARLLIASLTRAPERLNRWRARFPVRFAALGGLAVAVAVIGLVTGGVTFGAGSEAVKQMLQGHDELTPLYTVLKFVATWLTAWCGVPGGIFAPSLSIGAGIGDAVAHLASSDLGPALIALGMAGFLAAVTQAPLTAFIIVMEMVDGHAMVLSLMAAAMLASLISRMISRPLYDTLAEHMVGKAIAASEPVQASPSSSSQPAGPSSS